MKTVQKVAYNKQLRQEAAWSLLAADLAPEYVALLSHHLFDGERRLASSIFHERVTHDLALLKEQGFADITTDDARPILRQWVTNGYLERYIDRATGEEVYELSASALQAVSYIDQLAQKRTVATESRLSIVIQQLAQLASDTDPNPDSRIQSLLEEQRRIQDTIDKIRSGNIEPLSKEKSLERIREILNLVYELTNEFRQVRDKFNGLNQQLREKILESGESRGGVLEELFAGVDLIAESEAGRTFKAFWVLLTDIKQSAGLDDAIEQIMGREFAQSLTREERKFLSGMTRVLMARASDVQETLQFFARSLKQYVTNREYLEHRRFTELLKEAQLLARDIKNDVSPHTKIGFNLDLTSVKFASVAQMLLYDPSYHQVDAGITMGRLPKLSLDAVGSMVANSEINMKELERNIVAMTDLAGQATIKDILDKYPAQQGLGSIVGYLFTATRHGEVSPEGEETISWTGADGEKRRARIPLVYFRKGCLNGKQKQARKR